MPEEAARGEDLGERLAAGGKNMSEGQTRHQAFSWTVKSTDESTQNRRRHSLPAQEPHQASGAAKTAPW